MAQAWVGHRCRFFFFLCAALSQSQFSSKLSEKSLVSETVDGNICHKHMEKDMAVMGDKLILRGLKFYGFHGAIPEEKTLGQMFMLDIDAFLSLKKAGLSDNLADSISYVDIYNLAKEVVEGSSRNLLEAVAEVIASRTLKSFPQVTSVRVKLWKPNVALIQSTIDYLGVEIFRNRATE